MLLKREFEVRGARGVHSPDSLPGRCHSRDKGEAPLGLTAQSWRLGSRKPPEEREQLAPMLARLQAQAEVLGVMDSA